MKDSFIEYIIENGIIIAIGILVATMVLIITFAIFQKSETYIRVDCDDKADRYVCDDEGS